MPVIKIAFIRSNPYKSILEVYLYNLNPHGFILETSSFKGMDVVFFYNKIILITKRFLKTRPHVCAFSCRLEEIRNEDKERFYGRSLFYSRRLSCV